jgi:hypothetical protein
MVAVGHEVQLADAVDLDRRDRRAAGPGPAVPTGTAPGWRLAGSAGRSRVASPLCRRWFPAGSSAAPAAAGRASGATTSSSGTSRLPSPRRPRRRCASVTRNWRRLARRKSFSTSARGNPVSSIGPPPSLPAGKGRCYRADRANVLASPWLALAGAASSIAVEFTLVAAQADGVVFDLHAVAHIPDRSHVTALLVLTAVAKFDPHPRCSL